MVITSDDDDEDEQQTTTNVAASAGEAAPPPAARPMPGAASTAASAACPFSPAPPSARATREEVALGAAGKAGGATQRLALSGARAAKARFSIEMEGRAVEGVHLWSADVPYLYQLLMSERVVWAQLRDPAVNPVIYWRCDQVLEADVVVFEEVAQNTAGR